MYKYIKASRTVGFVGIWWYCTGKVIGRMVDVDNGYDDGRFIHYDNFKNHSTEWREVLNEQLPEQYDLLYPLQYKCIERGRVIYNIVTQSYEIACSQAASKDQKLIHAVVDAFHLSDCRYDVVAYNHYYITKPTGNSVIDDLDKYDTPFLVHRSTIVKGEYTMTILTLDCAAYLPVMDQDIAAHKEIELKYRKLKPEWQLSKQQMNAYVGFLTTVVSIIESRGFKIDEEYQSSESYSYFVRFSPTNYCGEEYKLDVKFRLSDHPIKNIGHRSDNGGKDVVFDSFDIAGFECDTIGQVINQVRILCNEIKSGDFSHFDISEEDTLIVL